MYADDSKIIGVINSIEDQKALQDDINRGVEWSNTWLMHFNVKKCKVMHVGKSKKRSAHVYTMDDSSDVTRELQETVLERDLVVMISNDLKWKFQVEAAATKANKTYIRPHLEFAIQAWSPYLEKDIETLEIVQRRVTKHIHGLSNLDYDERLKALRWMRRRERGDVILAFQYLHGNVELNLDWQWILPTGSGIRANDAPRITIPPLTRNCQQRANFFSKRVATSWRNLPTETANSNNLNELKNHYDKLLLIII
jgi:ribonuclease P/MRP protein subunit RPP40